MEEPEETLAQDFALEFAFALVVTAIIINIILLTRIRYGDALITHLTRRPYYVTLALLIVTFVNIVYLEIVYGTGRVKYVLNGKDLAPKQLVALTLGATRYILMFVFIFIRTQEHEALLIFVNF